MKQSAAAVKPFCASREMLPKQSFPMMAHYAAKTQVNRLGLLWLAAPHREIMMTPESIKLVQDSFKKVVPIADTAADLFYDRLFTIAPELRQMFPGDLREQKKKLIGILAVAVNNLHRFEQIRPAVEDLGRRHVAYGVTDEHYEPVGQALLWTLEQGLGDAFTPPLKAAWTKTYLTIADTMKFGASNQLAA